jgi:hypothetical protein
MIVAVADQLEEMHQRDFRRTVKEHAQVVQNKTKRIITSPTEIRRSVD